MRKAPFGELIKLASVLVGPADCRAVSLTGRLVGSLSASWIHMDDLTTNLLKCRGPECFGLQFQGLLITGSNGYDQ